MSRGNSKQCKTTGAEDLKRSRCRAIIAMAASYDRPYNLLFRENENGLLSPSSLPAQGERPPVVLPIVSPTVFLPFDTAKTLVVVRAGLKLDISETALKNVFALPIMVECGTIIFETANTPMSVSIKLFSKRVSERCQKLTWRQNSIPMVIARCKRKRFGYDKTDVIDPKINFNFNFYKNIFDKKE